MVEVKLDPEPQGDTLVPNHVILRVNTRDMRNVPEDELLDILNGLVGTSKVYKSYKGILGHVIVLTLKV